jgi:Cu/Ag efflux protein CusF
MSAKNTVSWLSIFTSSSTLICCALPALLVALGAGAALSGFVSAFPQIVWLSEHKVLVFGVAGAMLLASWWLQRRARTIACPPDAALAQACAEVKDYSRTILRVSMAIYLIGAAFAFLPALFSSSASDDAADVIHIGTGQVSEIYPAEKSITIRHDPMPTLKMGAMTMPFDVEDVKLLDGIAPKQRVEFQVRQQGADYIITSIKPVP